MRSHENHIYCAYAPTGSPRSSPSDSEPPLAQTTARSSRRRAAPGAHPATQNALTGRSAMPGGSSRRVVTRSAPASRSTRHEPLRGDNQKPPPPGCQGLRGTSANRGWQAAGFLGSHSRHDADNVVSPSAEHLPPDAQEASQARLHDFAVVRHVVSRGVTQFGPVGRRRPRPGETPAGNGGDTRDITERRQSAIHAKARHDQVKTTHVGLGCVSSNIRSMLRSGTDPPASTKTWRHAAMRPLWRPCARPERLKVILWWPWASTRWLQPHPLHTGASARTARPSRRRNAHNISELPGGRARR